ncbi:MAG: hypothetical protein J6U17_00860 [Kiritimatiellae bacterium]|nr:hypothetical protein [Kiritimatiellia bacterium]
MKVHFAGIGGVGMAALAVLMKSRGDEVSGCDLASSPRTRWLEALGIPVSVGHSAAHVADADLLVATPAVHADNPEVAAAKRVRMRGEVLAEIVGGRDSIAVCGSHGKTTTSTFIAKLLRALGEDVSWAIGGETGDFPVAGTGGADGPLVVEADESDGTLALYSARILVVTNCEYDHPDHFKTPADYFACYDSARRRAGCVIESESLTMDGLPPEIAATIDALAPHNRKNARAAVEVALRRGHSLVSISNVLSGVVRELPDRRFQRIWPASHPGSSTDAGPLVYTDYAHHPTEMKCAVAMAREKCRGRLRVLFQPHRHSRTKALLADFPAAFDGADEVVLCPTYAAFEPPVEGGDIADLYLACRNAWGQTPSKGAFPALFLARSCREAWRHAWFEAKSGDLTLLLGAGDIIKLVPSIIADMESAAARTGHGHVGTDPVDITRTLSAFSFFRTGGRSVGGGARRIVGMGSNTWISDLTTDDEYVRLDPSEFPAGRPGASLGIPWMAGIPGTVGGWIRMNAGAFGHSIGELVRRVKVDGKWIGRDECGFGYRTSAIDGVVEDVEWNDAFAAAQADAEDYLARRRRFPVRCCGSVFKNPDGDHAGRLLESVGAKGMRVGGAHVWEGHANVIVADEGATSSDILALARLVHERVRLRLGVALEPEIRGLEF